MNQIFDKLDIFFDLIKGQFSYGGKKYAADNKRESTDILFDHFGFRFSLGTICKYTFRFSNLARERDLLKISCYCFIYFLKRGFHLLDIGTYNSIDTTVKIKDQEFPNFVDKVCQYIDKNQNNLLIIHNRIQHISDKLIHMSLPLKRWNDIQLNDLLEIFVLSYLEWYDKFSKNAGQDQDVHLKTDNK